MFVLYRSSSASSRRLVFRFVDPNLEVHTFHFLLGTCFYGLDSGSIIQIMQEGGSLKHM